jgi:hypothetical protein
MLIHIIRQKIGIVGLDKLLRYMAVVIDKKMTLIINLRTEKVCEILHYDFSSLVGLFFLQNMNVSSNISGNEDLKFCFVFNNKLAFFKISKDAVTEIKSTKLSNIAIRYIYNSKFAVLGLEKSDRTFDFFNLSSERTWTKAHPFQIPLRSIKKERNSTGEKSQSNFKKLFSLFGRSSEEKKAQGDEVLGDKFQQKEQLYKKTQFYMESLYVFI